MKALEALHTRVSSPRLTDPAPTEDQLENIFKAALRAADHGRLRPWRFLIVKDQSRSRLGDLFVNAAREADPELSTVKADKLRSKPQRAPMVIVAISIHKDHPKVPCFEMDLSAAAATQSMLIAAHAQGVGAMWRTGSMAFNKSVMSGLGLGDNEKIVGFLYLGTTIGPPKPICDENLSDYFEEW